MVTPEEVQAILRELEPLLVVWHAQDTLGEIAIVRGGQEWQIEKRPRETHARVKRKQRREGYIERVG